MAKVIKQKVLRKGTKDDRSALGSREYLTRNEIEERYPICLEAQMIIDVLMGTRLREDGRFHII